MMTTFVYNAIDDLGKSVTGEIEAESRQDAMERISGRGLIPEDARKKQTAKSGPSLFTRAKVPAKDLILFTKQFKTLFQAGISVIQLFQIIEKQTENKRLKKISRDLAENLQQGESFYKSFKVYEKTFSPLYCAMLRAGERSGTLPSILERLIYIIEHEEKVKNSIRSAARYPIIVLCFLAVAFVVLLTFVVPKFAVLFERAGIELPLATRICIALYAFVAEHWMMISMVTALTGIFLTRYLNTKSGRLMRDLVLIHLPIAGPIVIKSVMSRFSSIFSILQASGIAIVESMGILSQTINNLAVAREFDTIISSLGRGQGLSGPLKKARYFTPMVIHMVAVGEESGNLDSMLNEIAVHYDAEIDYAVKGFSDALGPHPHGGSGRGGGLFCHGRFPAHVGYDQACIMTMTLK